MGLATAVGVFLATVPLHRDWFDLGVYYGTVDHWSRTGRIYDYLVPGTHYGFTYPPFAAVVMLPMTLVDWPCAVAISVLLNAGAAAVILHWSAGATLRRHSKHRWFAFAVVGCLLALLEPVRDTVSFGQVNLLLLLLVLADARLLSISDARTARHAPSTRLAVSTRQAPYARFAPYAGIGIGLAAAIKLTPAIFIGYLLLTRRTRAAATATTTALGATLLTLWAAPEASRVYWTEAIWNTDRVGSLAYVSNQSWQGLVARLTEPAAPSRAVWAIGVIALLCVWAWRARRAATAGNDGAGFALTGITACLISPVTWVHHLVWLIPALAVLVDAGLRSTPGSSRRRRLLGWTTALYVVLCSSVVWLWSRDSSGIDGFVGGNTYVWISLGLLLTLPVLPALTDPGKDRALPRP
ncbi:glycosyltransferase 87 family protein [Streptomyces sp. NPDC002889]|uniref:glycosyltransferase 87 family protein n=1 Tax=Streptomyces sp. NPDC002889 TaxID=3364669 RepID=UPI0036B5EE11